MVKIIKQAGEEPLVLHSDLKGPIKDLSLMRRSLLFAELSMISYNDPYEAAVAARAIGLPELEFYNHDGSQAYRFRSDHDTIIACRGTEPNEWNDIQADANAIADVAETAGRVHRGFNREVNDLWPMLENALRGDPLPLWFCGHSLGGAMATICAVRCLSSFLAENPAGLFTYGSPRVGDKMYVGSLNLAYYRWVNNNDIVPRVPPTWMGYRHSGQELYLDYKGRLRRFTGFRRLRDRLRGLLGGIGRWQIDYISDHATHQYIRHILALVRLEEGRTAGDEGTPEIIEIPQTRGANININDRTVGKA